MFGNGHCAICDAKVRGGMLMCVVHWRKVPKRVQTKVYKALDAWHANQLLLGELREVQDEAVRSVETVAA